VVVVFTIHEPSIPEAVDRRLFEGIAGFFCCVMILAIFNWVWKPGRRKIFGIASPRTVAVYSACVISLPAIVVINLRSDFRLGVLFYVPFLLLILAKMSARKDIYQ